MKNLKSWYQENIHNNFNKLDQKLEENGQLTKTDIWALSFPNLVKHFIVFVLKRNSDYSFHYVLEGKEYKYRHDIEDKSKRDKAELIFTQN